MAGIETVQFYANLLLRFDFYVKLGDNGTVCTPERHSINTKPLSTDMMYRNLLAVFTNGGPRALAWGILVVIAGALAQSASLAEMASMQPIAGAQYHWTHYLAPPQTETIYHVDAR